MWRYLLLYLGVSLGSASLAATDEPLRVSVYATAGDVLAQLGTQPAREQALQTLQPLRVTRLFLEGRRGGEAVPPSKLAEVRAFFEAHGIHCSGGIATVPGPGFGTRQNAALGWLNWESARTRQDIRDFFAADAPVFGELIVDDFFCTSDTSPDSERARGQRSWSEYRRDLLVSLIDPIMRQPARRANPSARLIIKFPQWYDRFHLFGYSPPEMAAQFEQVWVGTEVRNPKTRRMGFVQPTEGYVNFRWLSSVAGEKVTGAWFDHIECTPLNFVDQAYQSVLAGARELTLFHLGDLVEKNPGDALLASKLPELFDLAGKVRGRQRLGIPFYKPAGSDAEENLYLMDYLAMIGLPILPEASYPEQSAVTFLAAQAGADPDLMRKVRNHLEKGALVVLTPALVRKLGRPGMDLAGVEVGASPIAASALSVASESRPVELIAPLELDASLTATTSRIEWRARLADAAVPWLTRRQHGPGAVCVLNVRTFSEQDFRDAGEWLLAPKELGLGKIPQALADELRRALLAPLGIRFEGPSGVGLYLFQNARALYNFRDEAAQATVDGTSHVLRSHTCLWLGK